MSESIPVIVVSLLYANQQNITDNAGGYGGIKQSDAAMCMAGLSPIQDDLARIAYGDDENRALQAIPKIAERFPGVEYVRILAKIALWEFCDDSAKHCEKCSGYGHHLNIKKTGVVECGECLGTGWGSPDDEKRNKHFIDLKQQFYPDEPDKPWTYRKRDYTLIFQYLQDQLFYASDHITTRYHQLKDRQ